MLFPTDEDAFAYLVAAEPTLTEADDAGLVLVTDAPLTPTTRHWAGETLIGADRIAMDVWLIPVGPVVAKVAATVFGPGVGMRRAVAERALARLEAAYGPADATWPPVRPHDPSVSGASDLELLQGLMQAVLLTGARGCEGDALGPSLPGEVVALSCERDGVVVVYRQFADAMARDAAFASLADEASTSDVAVIPCGDGVDQGRITEVGRAWSVACWQSSSGLVMLWTEPDQPTLGAILAPASSDLVALWEDARFRS
jgi:hypothetical protein